MNNIVVACFFTDSVDALRYISVAESLDRPISSTTFTQCAPEATDFTEVRQNNGHYAVQETLPKISTG